jgi:hypothetical protein
MAAGFVFAGALSAASVLAPAVAGASVARAASHSHDAHFLLKSTSGNTKGDTTYINNKLSNGNRHALVFVTANWNPPGIKDGTYDTAPLGVWYNVKRKKWGVFNEDGSAMTIGMAFNVLIVPKPTKDAFVHTSTTASDAGATTYISSPATNHKPGVLLQVTQNWDPPGVPFDTNDHPVGVYFRRGKGKWGIFEENGADMPAGPSFNVLVGTSGTGARSGLLKATSSNTAFDYAQFSNPHTNNKHLAEVFATPVYNPGGKHLNGLYLDSAIGVWYDTNSKPDTWGVFREDEVDMTLHEGFNLLYYSS